MGNLYRLNSLFELELSQYPKDLVIEKILLEKSRALEYLFLLLSNQNDFTILSENPSQELLAYWKKNSIKHGKTIQTDTPYYALNLELRTKLPKETTLIEWGKTSLFNQKENKLEKKVNQIFISGSLNSKINQTKWKESGKLNKVKTVICLDKLEVEYCISTIDYPIVIKSEFGFSGEGMHLIKTKSDAIDFLKILPDLLLKNANGIIIEEWVEERKLEDFSGVFNIVAKKSELLAITKMIVDAKGVYRGSLLLKDYGKEYEKSMTAILNSFSRTNSSRNGIATLDGFTFQRENKIEIQYMSEINVRYSMGRILYELQRKIGSGKDESGIFFVPVKNKSLTFKFLDENLSKLKTQYKSEILMATPLTNSNGKMNPFLAFYIRNEKKLPLEIMNAIKKILA